MLSTSNVKSCLCLLTVILGKKNVNLSMTVLNKTVIIIQRKLCITHPEVLFINLLNQMLLQQKCILWEKHNRLSFQTLSLKSCCLNIHIKYVLYDIVAAFMVKKKKQQETLPAFEVICNQTEGVCFFHFLKTSYKR